MALFELPPKEIPREVLGKISEELRVFNDEMSGRVRILEDLIAQSMDLSEVTAGIAEAKRALFLLLYERLRQSEVDRVDEYCTFIEQGLEGLAGPAAKVKKE